MAEKKTIKKAAPVIKPEPVKKAAPKKAGPSGKKSTDARGQVKPKSDAAAGLRVVRGGHHLVRVHLLQPRGDRSDRARGAGGPGVDGAVGPCAAARGAAGDRVAEGDDREGGRRLGGRGGDRGASDEGQDEEEDGGQGGTAGRARGHDSALVGRRGAWATERGGGRGLRRPGDRGDGEGNRRIRPEKCRSGSPATPAVPAAQSLADGAAPRYRLATGLLPP